jgi:hypothetical protein
MAAKKTPPTPPPHDIARTTIELTRTLWAQVKAQAVLENRPAGAIVTDALVLYLKAAKGGR